ncbi:MAG TPA: V-type ATP synthase subunit D [Spirochaetia bacterium]|nr:V-type ATP synthase subunit D [Spirochaetia bacterium]
MARFDVPPTKSSLFAVKDQLAIAREGFELLEQKREILIMELMRLVEEVKLLERDLDRRVGTAYGALKQMLVRVGREAARDASEGITFDYSAREKQGKLMGIPLPTIEVSIPRLELKYSFMSTSGACDATTVEFFELLKLLARMAEIRTMVWRLAKEVRKTQRRVNALERIVIPEVVQTKRFIEGVLEEREREVFFVQKILKAKLLGDRV